jgi:hypothetical protein
MKLIRLILVSLFFSNAALAADIEWSGLYRIEGVSLHEPDLTTQSRGIDYGLQHLIMRPKIIASDGFTIRSQFDVFNSSAYPNSHMGQVFGNDVRNSTNTPNGRGTSTNADTSNTFSHNGQAGTLEVSQLYLTWDHEYGSLLVGRAPLQFGLGMSYSAGMGMFDHFYDTLDMVAYKFIYGNFFVLPMIGKSSTGALNRNDDVDDYLVQAQYENPETDLELGILYHIRKAGNQGSDAPLVAKTGDASNPTEPLIGGTGATVDGGVNMQSFNVYALKDTPAMRLGVEVAFQSGQTGVRTAQGAKVALGGYGIALEYEWRPVELNWKMGIKAGFATGDDPTTDGKYEGFSFNRNYDVAFMLFNHQLGGYDVFRTRMMGGGGGLPNSVSAKSNYEISQTDVESISNVAYFSPYAIYKMNDRWNMKTSLTTGVLNVQPLLGKSVSKDVGFELDYSLNFAPRKGVMWINEIGLLAPGAAFKGDGSQGYGASFTYGLQTKAAITF